MPDAEKGYTWTRLSLITENARRNPEVQFSSLAHLLNEEFLRDCHKSLGKNKAVGVDKVSWKEYDNDLDKNLAELVNKLKRKAYKPLPAKRVYIPKNAKELRPLGIPAHENKVVEMGVKRILESIYECDFLDMSYGFRPGRGCHQALRELNRLINQNPANHIVEADIKGFFDNVNHDKLMEFLKIRIVDPSMLFLIERFLKAGYVDNGLLVRPDDGTPQGSIISPMLANIFLHYVLDKWFDEVVRANTRGFCALVRYADDFVCVVRYADDAARIFKALGSRFAKYGLEIHPTKSRNMSFGRFEKENAEREGRKANTFDFLGFTHYCGQSRKGKFKVGRKTSRKKYASKCKALSQWLKKIRNTEETKVWWKTLRAKLMGHYRYYGVSDNIRSINAFYRMAVSQVRKWLNRRSQKSSMNWADFTQYLERYPLPKPRIVHSFYI